ncbi:MAG: DUF4162 domain-containing protein, partial [Phycisphaerae bacterium]|nr:DUF4162 domain-containing protein [Phycisphaerae bacterium]
KGRKILDGSMDEIRAQFNPRTIVVEPSEGDGRWTDTLRGLSGVSGVMHSGERGTYEVSLVQAADPRKVMGLILGDVPVRRIELRRATLEDVFVHLVEPGETEDVLRSMLGSGGDQRAVNADA